MKEFTFHGTISNPCSVVVRAETPEEAKRLLDENEFDVSVQHTHHIVDFIPDTGEPE